MGWKPSFLNTSNNLMLIILIYSSEALEMILSPDCPDDLDLEDENFMDTY